MYTVIKLCLAYDDKFSSGSGTSASGSIWGHLLYSFHSAMLASTGPVHDPLVFKIYRLRFDAM